MIRTLVEIRNGRVSIQETADETTVTVTVDDATSSPAARLYTAEEVASLQSSEARLVAAPLERQVAGLEADRDALREQAATLLRETDELRADLRRRIARNTWLNSQVTDAVNTKDMALGELREATAKAEMFKAQAYSENERAATLKVRAEAAEKALAEERNRAEQNKAWAERAETQVAKGAETISQLRANLEARDRHHCKVTKDRNQLVAQIGEVVTAVHGAYILAAIQTSWTSWTESQAAALAEAVRETRRIVGSPDPDTSQA